MIKKIVMKIMFIFSLLGIMSLSCCTPSPDPLLNSTEAVKIENPIDAESAYPINTVSPGLISESAYPVTMNDAEITQGPDFNINEPVKNDDTTITGVGPALVPIVLINLSHIDLVLGETIIDESGHFQFDLEDQLKSGEVIGIKLGDISDTDFNPNDFVYNENYFNRPYVGILFDIIIVE